MTRRLREWTEMEIWRRARRAALAVVLTSVVGVATPGRAGAVPGTLATHASTTTGACGWWWKETAHEIVSLSVCGVDGVWLQEGEPGQMAERTVFVDWYSCDTSGSSRCLFAHHKGKVTRQELVLDPLLRMAGIHTVVGSCAVDLWFSGTSEAEPAGALAEYAAEAPRPVVSFGGHQVVSRPALWTGRVCGQELVDGSGSEARLWRDAGGGMTWLGAERAPGHEE